MTTQNIKKLAGVLGCVVLLWSLTGAQGARKTYEIHSQIPESVFKSDSARALDTYERIVDRALDLNRRQLDMMDQNIREMSKQLTRVESKLDRLLNSSLSTERALDISQPEAKESLDGKPKDPNASNVEILF